MVVQHNISAMTANRYYTKNNSALGKSMEKLSSGLAINRAGDDAAGLAVSEKMRAQIGGLTQASKNAQDGISMVQTFEGALQETDNILQRMRTLAVQSANGSFANEVDRDAIQLEFDQLNAELDEIADTDYNGVIVLNGGTMADGEHTADPTTGKIEYSATGGAGGAGGAEAPADDNTISGTADTSKTLVAGISVNWKYNDATDPEGNEHVTIYADTANKKAYDADGNDITDIIGTYKSAVGNALEVSSTNGKIKDTVADTPVGEDATETLGEVKSTEKYEVDNATLYKDADNHFYVEDSDNPGSYVSADPETYTKDGKAITNDDGTLKTTTAPEDPSEDDSDPVSISNAYDEGIRNFTYADNITLQVGARSKDAVKFTFKYSAEGMGDDRASGQLEANMNCSSREDGLNTKSLSLKTQETANKAIDRIDNAINKVSMVRATFGAIQNRLEHKISNLDTNAENMTAAESRIRDTQMDQEMMKFTSSQILSQASQSMLAQANSLPQGVLQLLG